VLVFCSFSRKAQVDNYYNTLANWQEAMQ